MIDLVKQEAAARQRQWTALHQAGGPTGVQPQMLRSLGIYGGAQGIWVDKARTSKLTPEGTGITVGVLHTGSSYADDLSSDGVLDHYPKTGRPPGRDLSEVLATKAAGQLGLPIFVITYPRPNSDVRDVHLGWVEDWDDTTQIFLITFGQQQPTLNKTATDDQPFELAGTSNSTKYLAPARPGQARFAFRVFQRYGSACAVCGIAVKEVLEAAHIRSKRHKGSDDPRNGLVLCALHHRAYDARLFAIDPETLAVHYRLVGPDAATLHITQPTIAHLPKQPHPEALQWAWLQWTQA